ncbi:hypothetical protein LCGC14_1367440 [marine sediment metagenome]|uniref:Ribbon-helix-helix protein CopG domain-containing protein n=1 Tax=marine sediment metagenome TaxID=412755 RepID=A0A0F9N8B1_9ZZZZ
MPKDDFTSICVSIPTTVLADVDLQLFDPVRCKIKYGTRSRLIVGLLERWLRNTTVEATMALPAIVPPVEMADASGAQAPEKGRQ